MIDAKLKIFMIIALAGYFFLILLFVKRKSLSLKYALIWLLSGILMLVMVLFPQLISDISNIFGVAYPINTVFALVIFFNMLISMSLTEIVSRISARNKTLTQTLALQDKQLRDMEKRIEELEKGKNS